MWWRDGYDPYATSWFGTFAELAQAAGMMVAMTRCEHRFRTTLDEHLTRYRIA